jgi:hypothetical protein
MDVEGTIVIRWRVSRARVLEFFSTLMRPRDVIGFAQHWLSSAQGRFNLSPV